MRLSEHPGRGCRGRARWRARYITAIGGLLCLLLAAGCNNSEQNRVRVAVAANFAAVAQDLAKAYQAENAVNMEINIGSTGQLATQIQQGAPFHLLLAADVKRPQQLETAGLVEPDTRRTYAIGRLVFWAPDQPSSAAANIKAAATISAAATINAAATIKRATVESAAGENKAAAQVMEVLLDPDLVSVAMANWKLAPYGEAAREVLSALDLAQWLGLPGEGAGPKIAPPKLVTAENVAQVYALVSSGSVSAAFVSAAAKTERGLSILLPQQMHAPIQQQVVLLRGAQNAAAARGFYDFLFSAQARAIIAASGYALPAPRSEASAEAMSVD